MNLQELKQKLVELGYDPVYGARPMRRVIQDRIENQIAKKILKGEFKKGERIIITPMDFFPPDKEPEICN